MTRLDPIGTMVMLFAFIGFLTVASIVVGTVVSVIAPLLDPTTWAALGDVVFVFGIGAGSGAVLVMWAVDTGRIDVETEVTD